MAEAAHSSSEVGRDRDRIVNLSDGVFAIAITLLILDIRVPDIPGNLVAGELPGQLLSLWPKYLGYFLSFAVISTFWVIHHSIFRPITDYDRPLLYLNFLFLMLVAFVPFPTSLLGEYGDHQLPVAVYAATLAVGRLLLTAIHWYSTRNERLLGEAQDPRTVRFFLIRGLTIPAIFLLSIGISFFSVICSARLWTLRKLCHALRGLCAPFPLLPPRAPSPPARFWLPEGRRNGEEVRMIDHLDRDDEAHSLMLRLVADGAEGARLDAEELRTHGFEPVQVAGLDRLLWKQDDGPLDGALLTGWSGPSTTGWPRTRRDTAMTNDIEGRALRLIEQEERGTRQDAERRAEQEREGRLRDAIARVKAQDGEIAVEQARKDAGAEAAEITCERYELEQRIEAEAMALNRSLSELESLDRRHREALHRAGRPLGHDHWLTDVITGWWRARFGGWNNLTGTPSPQLNAEDRPLHERDPMAHRDGS